MHTDQNESMISCWLRSMPNVTIFGETYKAATQVEWQFLWNSAQPSERCCDEGSFAGKMGYTVWSYRGFRLLQDQFRNPDKFQAYLAMEALTFHVKHGNDTVPKL
jgi:hypothetical protein